MWFLGLDVVLLTRAHPKESWRLVNLRRPHSIGQPNQGHPPDATRDTTTAAVQSTELTSRLRGLQVADWGLASRTGFYTCIHGRYSIDGVVKMVDC